MDFATGIDFASYHLLGDPPVRIYPLPRALVLELLVAATVCPRAKRFFSTSVRCHWRLLPQAGPDWRPDPSLRRAVAHGVSLTTRVVAGVSWGDRDGGRPGRRGGGDRGGAAVGGGGGAGWRGSGGRRRASAAQARSELEAGPEDRGGNGDEEVEGDHAGRVGTALAQGMIPWAKGTRRRGTRCASAGS
jgi:hypothetical protein